MSGSAAPGGWLTLATCPTGMLGGNFSRSSPLVTTVWPLTSFGGAWLVVSTVTRSGSSRPTP